MGDTLKWGCLPSELNKVGEENAKRDMPTAFMVMLPTVILFNLIFH